ncbi:hypothetical protein [Paludibaculum fermentans]|uniref:hypothetical protein n=1 Tax=Paludibaculum fermentans TaxID=1473598 RepID=UPI001ACC0667|nr:hypothetical protein [Acidobacteriota bacterium]
MGANPTQALAFLLFLVAFVFIGAGLFSGGSVLFMLIGLVLLGASVAVFLKAKPLEHLEG